MKRISNILKIELWLSVAVAIILVVLYENALLLAGDCVGDAGVEFVVTSMMELLTVCAIPVAMRLFRFSSVRRRLVAGTDRQRLWWASLRLMMLCVPMVANTLFYYWFGFKVAFGYMAIIGLVSLSFVYPSRTRCETEFTQEQ